MHPRILARAVALLLLSCTAAGAQALTPMAPRLGAGGVAGAPDARQLKAMARDADPWTGGATTTMVPTVREYREIMDGVGIPAAYRILSAGTGGGYVAEAPAGAGSCRIHTLPTGSVSSWSRAQIDADTASSGKAVIGRLMPGATGRPARVAGRPGMRFERPGEAGAVAWYVVSSRTRVALACDGLSGGDLAAADRLAARITVP